MSTNDFFEGLDDIQTMAKSSTEKAKEGPSRSEWLRLTRIVQDLTTNLDIDSLLESVMDYAIEITKAEHGFLVLLDEKGELDFRVARGIDRQEIAHAEKAASRTVIQKVIESHKPILENDVPRSDDLARKHSLMKLDIKSVMGVPLISKDNLIGVAYVDTRSITNLFTKEDLVNLETFVNLAAIAIEKARLFQNLTQSTQNYKILKEYHENILKSLPMGVVVVESDRTIEYLNENARDLWGLKPGEGVGMALEKLFPQKGKSRETAIALWEKYQKSDREEEGEISLGNKTYQISFFDVLRWRRQDVRSGMLILDISLRKKLEADLVESEKRATVIHLAGGIAHEVNNLLTPILGRTAMVQMRMQQAGSEMAEVIGGDIKVIDQQANRIRKVVEDLNRLSRPAKPEMEPICVGKCLGTAVEVLTSTAGRIKKFDTSDPNAALYLRLDLEENLPLIQGNAQSIEQMFINLIINAAHAVEDKGKGQIILRAFSQNGNVVAKIEDTGTGIPPEILQHIFEPYFTTKDSGRGTGLGMPIVRQIADLHKAQLDLDTKVGKGTTITISFPAIDKSPK
jgi:signal transduction histidine kinase